MPAWPVSTRYKARTDVAGFKLRPIFKSTAQIKAMMKLEAGPAAATKAISRRGFLRLFQLIGTGLAHPNTN